MFAKRIKKNATAIDAGVWRQRSWKTSLETASRTRSRFRRSGIEVIWNHITRYRGGSVTRLVTQATPQPNGSFSLVYFQDQFVFRDKMKDYDPKNPGNILFYFKQER